ncbi:MAG: alpha/beta hydrolase [Clostridia bacterium]|nr:alpha/beta hydrolase [Clostridia bacterium]
MGKRKKKHSLPVRILIWVLIFLLVFSAVSLIVCRILMNNIFCRNPFEPQFSTSLIYEDIADRYPREALSFSSGEHRLQAYLYGDVSGKGLVVVSHGIGSCHEGYLSQIMWFVDHGWQVFAFDNTGSHESEGEGTRGLVQSALDLHAALSFIESDPVLCGKQKVLFGHSWGGYAVASVLSFGHEVAAVASVAGYSEPVGMMMHWAEPMIGWFRYTQYPYLWLNNKLLFGTYSDLSAKDSINAVTTPVLLVHGTADDTVPLEPVGIAGYRDEITNPNVEVILVDEPMRNGHSSIFRSIQALEYLDSLNVEYRELEKQLGRELSEEERKAFFADIDKFKVNELDESLFRQIEAFFSAAIGQ